jgi:hypothetical protein
MNPNQRKEMLELLFAGYLVLGLFGTLATL